MIFSVYVKSILLISVCLISSSPCINSFCELTKSSPGKTRPESGVKLIPFLLSFALFFPHSTSQFVGISRRHTDAPNTDQTCLFLGESGLRERCCAPFLHQQTTPMSHMDFLWSWPTFRGLSIHIYSQHQDARSRTIPPLPPSRMCPLY